MLLPRSKMRRTRGIQTDEKPIGSYLEAPIAWAMCGPMRAQVRANIEIESFAVTSSITGGAGVIPFNLGRGGNGVVQNVSSYGAQSGSY